MDFTAKEQDSGISCMPPNVSLSGKAFVERHVRTFDLKRPFFELVNGASKKNIECFNSPIVLTVNSTSLRDWSFLTIKTPPRNLMFVRVLTTTWNLVNVHCAVHYYAGAKVPVVLTFERFAKPEDIPVAHRKNYYVDEQGFHRITRANWSAIMIRFGRDPFVYSCGQEGLDDSCKRCGNCLREYFATMERLQ